MSDETLTVHVCGPSKDRSQVGRANDHLQERWFRELLQMWNARDRSRYVGNAMSNRDSRRMGM